MTPAEKQGLMLGEVFIHMDGVKRDCLDPALVFGDIVQLVHDDGTGCPLFARNPGSYRLGVSLADASPTEERNALYIYLEDVQKIKSRDECTEEEKDMYCMLYPSLEKYYRGAGDNQA